MRSRPSRKQKHSSSIALPCSVPLPRQYDNITAQLIVTHDFTWPPHSILTIIQEKVKNSRPKNYQLIIELSPNLETLIFSRGLSSSTSALQPEPSSPPSAMNDSTSSSRHRIRVEDHAHDTAASIVLPSLFELSGLITLQSHCQRPRLTTILPITPPRVKANASSNQPVHSSLMRI